MEQLHFSPVLSCEPSLPRPGGNSALSRRDWLIGVEVDPLGAGDLHHSSMQAGVGDQLDHALRYLWGSEDKQSGSVLTLWSHRDATQNYVSLLPGGWRISPFSPPSTPTSLKQGFTYSRIPNLLILLLKSSLNFTNLPILSSCSTERSRGVLTKAGHTTLMRTP